MEGRCVGCPDEQNAEIAFLGGVGEGEDVENLDYYFFLWEKKM